MAAHATSPEHLAGGDRAGVDAGGVERGIARFMPIVVLGMVAILGIAWWMAAQPPPGPGWNNPNGPQGQNPQYPQYPQQPYPPPPPQAPASSGCSACAGDCVSGIDCADCVDCGNCADCIDCGDCVSGIDCSCSTAGNGAGSSAGTVAVIQRPSSKRACSTNPWKRLAGSSGLLLPLFVLIGWRRRLRS